METIGGQLRRYAAAMADPTRAMILLELGRADELTATQLAKRLGLTANNVYHHIRILRRQEVVLAPRAVPGPSYVEKYYRIEPQVRSALWREPAWFDQAIEGMTAADRQALLVSLCLTMSYMLQQAAQRYLAMEPELLDHLVREQQLGIISIREVDRGRLKSRLLSLRRMLLEERGDPEVIAGTTDMVLIAALPLLLSEPAEAPE